MKHTFPTSQSQHLRGPKMMSRLKMDLENDTYLFDVNGQGLDWIPCEGVIQVRIVVPRTADGVVNFVPFLSMKNDDNKKVYRALCSICVKTFRKSLCPHSDDQRSFITTISLSECLYSVKLGYEVTEGDSYLMFTTTFLFPVADSGCF